jgi:hypothetical protein
LKLFVSQFYRSVTPPSPKLRDVVVVKEALKNFGMRLDVIRPNKVGSPNSVRHTPVPAKVFLARVSCSNATDLAILLAPVKATMKSVEANVFSTVKPSPISDLHVGM